MGDDQGIRVIVATDHCLLGLGLQNLLAGSDGFADVTAAGTAAAALALTRARGADVVLVDEGLPDGPWLVGELSDAQSACPLIFDLRETERDILFWMQAGARGYIPRHASMPELCATVDGVLHGRPFRGPRIERILRRAPAHARHSHAGRTGDLTNREREVLRLLEDGLSNREIADRLSIEVSTVKNHVHNVLDKLGVSRRGQAAAVVRES
jgi:DNA-binding NarL/FixJ family response regulator